MNIENLCMNCMGELNENKQCARCGDLSQAPQPSPYLPLKTSVGNKYIVGRVISSNSEGVSYVSYDIDRKTPVVIREFLPEEMVERGHNAKEVKIKAGYEELYVEYLEKFFGLWEKLSRVRGVSALVTVVDIIQENNTVYAVSEYIESISLNEFLNKSKSGILNWDKAKILFMPVLSALSTLHNLGVAHYAVNPDNLLIGRDGKLRLTGFSIAETRLEGTQFQAELVEGYSAIEQYDCTYTEGNWTDVYGFCAVLYRALSGIVPLGVLYRADGENLPMPDTIPEYVVKALINGLQVNPESRTKDIEALVKGLSAPVVRTVATSETIRTATPIKTQATVLAEENEDEKQNANAALIAFLISLGVGLILFAGILFYNKHIMVHYGSDTVKGFAAVEKWLKGEPNEENTTTPEDVEMFKVINFVGLNYNEVSMNTGQSQRYKIRAKYEFNSTVEKDRIISQSLKPGTEVPTGTEIIFIVSLGPETESIPDVRGWSEKIAREELEYKGFKVNVVYVTNNGDAEAGTVAYIKPKEGSVVEKGSTVTIEVWDEVETQSGIFDIPSIFE